ncbi:MAG: pyruvate, phosphate dikinase, partial [Candidatus Zixiibacteriota bacterium]
MKKKYVYAFGAGRAEGKGDQRELLGGKGAGLAEMTNIGLPVPAGFTITVEACEHFYQHNGQWPPSMEAEIRRHLAGLEKTCGKKLGDDQDPLLVSVRSGAAQSMPGMMETILNLGLSDRSVIGLAEATDNPRFAWDAYRRFIQMYSTVVVGLSKDILEDKLSHLKERLGVTEDTEIPAKALRALCEDFRSFFREQTGREFPQDPWEQLVGAINAVFHSWNAEKAVTYRRVEKITDLNGTGVNVQQMVFGNMGDDSGTGVCFTRDPSTGENVYYGDLLINAQGEDVVAGIRTPVPLKKLARVMPKAYKQLTALMTRLEKHYKDMQDMEFTIQNKVLYILQTRTGKRTAEAAVKNAVDMVQERLIPKKEAVNRVTPEQLDRLLHPHFDPKAKRNVIAKGLPASPGAAVGQVVFTADTAEAWNGKGKKVVLVRIETSPEDIGGMDAAVGILTARGGMTSHAAVVARGMGKCCVAGVGSLNINYKAKKLTIDKLTIKEGDWISLDGSTGEVMTGQLATVEPTLSGDFGKFMKICDQIRSLGVRTNADTPEDSKRARDFGAEGIGLTRTEHMFFEGDRIWPVRQMILAADDYAQMLDKINIAETAKEKKAIEKEYATAKKQFEGALKKLLPYHRSDFEGIFKAMAGLPVTIRLLDPPLHEFLPQDRWNQAETAKWLGVKPAVVKAMVEQLHEFNPMLGHRGCRLAVTYPAIYRMQTRAIIEAALNVKKTGKVVLPEIMIPLAGAVSELKLVKDHIIDEIKAVFKERKAKIKYMIGTMIEVPRAALTADEIAKEAEFFSFGTNDLTQMTMGFSR